MRKQIFWLLVTVLALVGCRRQELGPIPSLLPADPPLATATAVPTAEARVPTPTTVSTAGNGSLLAEAVPPQPLAAPVWPLPIVAEPPLARTSVMAEQQATSIELSQPHTPGRDDTALAFAYRGLNAASDLTVPLVAGPLAVGAQQSFKIANIDSNTVETIDAVLIAVSEHAYFWFDTGPGSFVPTQIEVEAAAAAFDTIYETVVFYFGPESNPGIDGDPRVHVVNASPLVLCDVTRQTMNNCGLAGYFSTSNMLPAPVNPNSNEREMFLMNVSWFGTDFYLNVLGHEFRHMVEDNYDRGDAEWESEGSATLAEELLGYPGNARQRGNSFLQNPDQQLNRWSDKDRLPRYGQGYVLNRYIFDRLGIDLYRQFATSPDTGLLAVDSVAAANGLALSGESLWLDWLVALAIHSHPGALEMYRFQGTALDTVTMTAVGALPTSYETTVYQYAADYYELPEGAVQIDFTGSTLVPLLDTLPASGQTIWYAHRANYSNPRLTRTFDLQNVDTATLHYAAYTDIEKGYDFAYVAVSTDNGRTWQGLAAENMQGLAPDDDPADVALTERFYTGRNRTWVQETIDLSPYAGQVIQLRFEYVTDLALNYGGVALDNIAIPEINFYDDAETMDAAWIAEGFTRATAYLPQTWHLQLITFAGNTPDVTSLTLPADQTLSFTVEAERGEKRPILIIAATAPMTMEPAHYELVISKQ